MREQDAKLKSILLDMFSWFHEFCVQNGLRYYALGGTMLGAARHGGFIPWDDDIDVGMPREDYVRLEALMGSSPQNQYILETPYSKDTDFLYPFSKLYDTRTTLVENTRSRIKRGVYLDIFPLDGAGNSEEEARRHFAPVKFRRNLLLAMYTGLRKERSFYKNMAVLLLGAIPNRIVDRRKMQHSIDRMCQSRAFEACSWVGNMMGTWMERELMPRAFFGTPKAYVFETITIFGVENADAYLTRLYGNWRELPPVDQRKTHHDFCLLDLESSYLKP